MATKSNLDKARHEGALAKLRWEWYRLRIEGIHRRVSAYDVLRQHGVELRSDMRAEQFACPFHGKDDKPSARIHPESSKSPSHAWCFVCQERWDAIGLTMKFQQVKFGQALSYLERTYSIETPAMPEDLFAIGDEVVNEDLDKFWAIYEVCELRLRMVRDVYFKLQDLKGFLAAGFLLDKLRHQVENLTTDPIRGLEVLQQLLGKIGDKLIAGDTYATPDEVAYP